MKQEEIFKRLRELRENKELKQKDLASTLNVSRPNYTRWETKEKIIPLTKLNDLCNFYKINMDYVIGLSDEVKEIKENVILDKEIIGNNIKSLRKKHNLSQEELANILGTTHSVISAYELGKTLILTSFLIEICLYFNESADKLCNRE